MYSHQHTLSKEVGGTWVQNRVTAEESMKVQPRVSSHNPRGSPVSGLGLPVLRKGSLGLGRSGGRATLTGPDS